MVSGPYYDQNGLKRACGVRKRMKGLRAYVKRYGHSNWRQLLKFAGLSRCGKSCRLRWLSYLKPNIKHGNYTQEEEKIIIKLNEQHGNKFKLNTLELSAMSGLQTMEKCLTKGTTSVFRTRLILYAQRLWRYLFEQKIEHSPTKCGWSQIAKQLPRTTDSEIKNHWYSRPKKRIESNEDEKMISEFKVRPNDTSEGEITNSAGGAPSNVPENSRPMYAETSYNNEIEDFTEESSAISSWEIFETFNNFWTEPFMVENKRSQNHSIPDPIYATNELDMDQYVSYLWDNTDLCQVMQELAKDPK